MSWLWHDRRVLGSFCLGIILGISVDKLYQRKDDHIFPSPLETQIPGLSESEVAKLPYPPDSLPGARDVKSPYGSLRIYEWGPENGRKVLMVHGISTPSIALAGIAENLVRHGCRVMLFGQSKGLLDDPEASTVCRALTQPLDLPGRGYSSAPSPNLHPQSSAFFTNVLLYVLASSPLAWTGPSSFAAIGYSLGGGIVVNFVSSFCNLISSVILLAPSGLIRPYHFAWQSKFLYSNSLVPQWILECLVRQRLMRSNDPDQEQRDSAVGDQIPGAEGSGASTAAKRGFDVAKVVDWQIRNHAGAIQSYMSSIRHAPISGQHEVWAQMSEMLDKAHMKLPQHSQDPPFHYKPSVFLICGDNDPIIIKDELKKDATAVLGGPEKLTFRTLDAGHDFPITEGTQVAEMIIEFWQSPGYSPDSAEP